MKKIINYSEAADSLNNIVYIPDNVNTDICELPLLVYLHGAGERGSNLSHLSRHAIPRLIDNGGEYPALVLCPQCTADAVWDNIPAKIKKTIDITVDEYGIKPDRIVLTGSSMGGFGHNDGIEKAYEDPYLVKWLIDLRRQNFNLIPEFLEEMF